MVKNISFVASLLENNKDLTILTTDFKISL